MIPVKGRDGIVRWHGPRPTDDPEPTRYQRVDPSPEERRTLTCVDCGTPIHRGSTRCMKHAVELNYGRPRTPHATLGVTCADCGCLLLPGERCPSCLLWAELDVCRWSWSRVMAA